jgi:6-pyruvoyl-tetrahydropterin synthase
MPYRFSKTFVLEKSTFRPSKSLLGATHYQEDFCLPECRKREVKITFGIARLHDDEMKSDFDRLVDKVTAYVEHFDHATCINARDPRRNQFARSYNRLIELKGEPSAALLAQMIYEEAATALSEERFASLAGWVKVECVCVQEDDLSWAEYSNA